MSVSIEFCVLSGRDVSSRKVLPTVLCHCVCSTRVINDAALACVGMRERKQRGKFEERALVLKLLRLHVSPSQ